jgi:hypothetical protein
MGTIWAHRLPEYLSRWDVPFRLLDGWKTRARTSGGFNDMRGVVVHHGASPLSMKLDTSVAYCSEGAPFAPIGNALLSRSKDGPVLVAMAAGATNTAGKGGPKLSSRGLIPLDSANSVTFNIEAENNGTTEPWPDDMCDVYVRTVCAVLQWANECTPGAPLGPGDVWAHHEWAPGRKIDPAGPSRFNGQTARAKWDMDRFRGEVFMALVAGPPTRVPSQPTPPAPANVPELPQCGMPPPQRPGARGEDVRALQWAMSLHGWYTYALDGDYGPRTAQAVQKMQRACRAAGLDPGPIDGWYGEQTRAAYCSSQGYRP